MRLDEPAWWYAPGDDRRTRALAPLGRLYGWIAEQRYGRATPYRSRLGVICIGNFTAGGTGKTPLGLRMRALQSNRVLAALAGVRVKRVDSWAWLLAGLFAGVSGLFMGNMVRLNPTVLTFLVIPAMAAALVGRMNSLGWTVVGGLLIGVIEALANLQPQLQRYGSATAFVVAIAAVLWQQRRGIGLSRDNSHLE